MRIISSSYVLVGEIPETRESWTFHHQIFENDFLKITFHLGEWLGDGETMWDALSEKGSLGLGCALLEGRCKRLRTVKVWMDVEKVRSALSEIDRHWEFPYCSLLEFFFLLQRRQYMNKISRSTVVAGGRIEIEAVPTRLRQAWSDHVGTFSLTQIMCWLYIIRSPPSGISKVRSALLHQLSEKRPGPEMGGP